MCMKRPTDQKWRRSGPPSGMHTPATRRRRRWRSPDRARDNSERIASPGAHRPQRVVGMRVMRHAEAEREHQSLVIEQE